MQFIKNIKTSIFLELISTFPNINNNYLVRKYNEIK